MSKSNTFENGLLLLAFTLVAFTLVGDASGLLGSAAAGNLYLSGHTADPGEAGDQTTSEIAYVGYARVPLARSNTVFSVVDNTVALVTGVDFPAGTGGTGTITHAGFGTSSTGVGKLLYSGAVTPNIVCGNGVTPRINSGIVVVED